MKFLLTVIALLPVIALDCDKDYGGMYKNSDLVIEGHLSGEVLEKIKVTRESKHPDIDFREYVFLYTYLIVDGSVKFQNGYQSPYDEVEIEGINKVRYRILIPEDYYLEPNKAKIIENPHTWFLVSSPLVGSMHAFDYLALPRVRMFIPDYMEGAIGVSIVPERKVSKSSR